MRQMKYCLRFFCLFCLFLSCKQNGNNIVHSTTSINNQKINNKDSAHPIISPSEVLSSFNNFWIYWSNEVFLTRDFIPLDTGNIIITRKVFLQKLISGKYIPLRLNNGDSGLIYQLYKIHGDNVSDEIGSVTKQYAQQFYNEAKMEGQVLPDFSFKDINGNIYNQENCKGKIVVLNCWFIHCTSCVLEIPDLNNLVKQYSSNKNIVFIALAFDNSQQLKEFLSKKDFDYAIVGDMQNYMTNKLHINNYPTQIIVDKTGRIFRFLESADDLNFELKRLLH